MPRNLGNQVESNFVQGLFTEATSLSFPRNSCIGLKNVVIDNKGKVSRTLGMEYEEDYETETFVRDDYYVDTYLWKSPAGVANTDLVVVRIGDKVYFYETQSSDALSAGCVELTGTPISIDLDTYKPSGGTINPQDYPCTFASGLGLLYIANPAIDPIQVEYDSSTPAVTVTEIDIRVRDINGVDDGLDVDERPAGNAITDNHRYNLYNQGWHEAIRESTTVRHAHVLERRWVSSRGGTPNQPNDPSADPDYWPSNADVWYYMNSNASVSWVPDFTDLYQQDVTAPAPRGKFIIDAFEPDRNNVITEIVPNQNPNNWHKSVTISSVTNAYTTKLRPKAIAFYAGRVWYAGVDAEGFNNTIWFSQVVETPEFAGECFQKNDPTAGLLPSDLLDSDGGTLIIQEAGNIIAMTTYASSLLIFCENGVWALSGSDNSGFKATDFNINRLSGSDRLSSTGSLVSVHGVPFWWSPDGIYTVDVGQIGDISIASLTLDTIDTFYKAIPESEKQYAQGTFDSRTFEIKWLYNSSITADIDAGFEFDRILKYNIRTKGFTVDHIDGLDSGSPEVIGVISVDNQGTIGGTKQRYSSVTKYLTSKLSSGTNFTVTFSEQWDSNHRNWDTASGSTGKEYDSFVETAYMVDGEANKTFQSNYITVHTENVTDGSATIQGRWDFTNSGNSGKWSNKQEVYPSNSNRDYKYRKIKIRGQGKALSLRIDSVDRDPFCITGWSIFETSNALP